MYRGPRYMSYGLTPTEEEQSPVSTQPASFILRKWGIPGSAAVWHSTYCSAC
jgi:hypothetical protein